MEDRVEVSVVATVLNEVGSLDRLLGSLEEQTRQPDEVVIVDGGSVDGTWEWLQERARGGTLPLRVLRCEGANISRGRNVAIGAARGAIIAVTDAGVRLDRRWLERLVAPFFAPGGETVMAVAGFFEPDPHTLFERAMGATVLPEVTEIDPERFLPSSRSVAFRRHVWELVGGYPEWLDYCEDLLFDFAVRERFGPFRFAPDAVAYFRPRPSLRSFFLQYYRYARGDGKAALWPRRHAIRYATYLGLVPGLLLLGVVHSPLWWVGFLLGGGIYTARPFLRLRRWVQDLSWVDRIRVAAWVPVIRVVGDLAKMIGYPVGVAWRVRHRPPVRTKGCTDGRGGEYREEVE